MPNTLLPCPPDSKSYLHLCFNIKMTKRLKLFCICAWKIIFIWLINTLFYIIFCLDSNNFDFYRNDFFPFVCGITNLNLPWDPRFSLTIRRGRFCGTPMNQSRAWFGSFFSCSFFISIPNRSTWSRQ